MVVSSMRLQPDPNRTLPVVAAVQGRGMRFVVWCESCGVADIAHCPNRDDAEHVATRHHVLTGHDAAVDKVLDTPLEGLL